MDTRYFSSIYSLLVAAWVALTCSINSAAASRLLFVFSKYICENSLLACPLIVRAWMPWLIVPPYITINKPTITREQKQPRRSTHPN